MRGDSGCRGAGRPRTGLARFFRSLANRNYRLYASGQAVSLTGTWMQRTAQGWLVLQLAHDSGTALGVTLGLQFLPMLLFGLWGGVVADRYSKRRVLVVTQVAMGVQALSLGLLAVLGLARVWHVYLLALLLGCITVVDNPTRQSFAVEMVGPEHVANAVALNSATVNLSRLIGPAIGGWLISQLGTGPVFLVNAASYIAVIAGLLLIREADLDAPGRVPRARGQLREGLRYVRGRPDLILVLVLVAAAATFGQNFQVTIALMARGVYHTGASSYGLLSTALAVGSLAGALVAAGRSTPRIKLVIVAAGAFGVTEAVAGIMPAYWAFMLLLVPTGAMWLTLSTAANSTVQLSVPSAMRGRVMALYLLLLQGTTPIGAPLIGWVAQKLGARYSFIVGGAVPAGVTAVAVLYVLFGRRFRSIARIDYRL